GAGGADGEEWAEEGSQVRGEALYEQGRFDDAEAVLAPADEAADAAGDASELAADLATVRSVNLAWGLQRPADAIAVRRRARERMTSSALRDILLSGEAAMLTFSGRPLEAVTMLDANPPSDDRRAHVARAIAAAPALAFVGRTTEAFEIARVGFEEHATLGDVVAMANPGTH